MPRLPAQGSNTDVSDAPHKFNFHIGDYLRDTEELSLMQHGAYLRLMLWYYSTAKPLPNDLDRIYRRTGSTSREEKAAIEFVLGEFFKLQDGKWSHKRIEEEIAAWEMATHSARASAKKRWEEFKKNKGSDDANALEAHSDGNANPDASLLPVTNSLNRKVAALPDWLPLDAWKSYLEMRKKIRRPPTDRAVELAIAKLAKFRDEGHDPKAVLEQSVMNGWQDLFAPREGSAQKKRTVAL